MWTFIWTMWDIKFLVGKHPRGTSQPFIWTMWDIKITTRGYSVRIVSFHLNHVGYKAFISSHKFFKIYSPFIWTMWDIKESEKNLCAAMLKNFHLNHVGYKDCLHHSFYIPYGSFHLNHVGYKALLFTPNATCRLPFIWTMWDIKEGGMK